MKRAIFIASRWSTLIVAGLALAACAPKPAAQSTPAPAGPPLKPVASVLDLMLGQVDPAADFLWESVATISTRKGVEERRPHTDAEWQDVRLKALQVIEAANLLMMDGRKVATPGQQLAEPGGQGDFTPDQAQAAIDADRATFVSFARALQDAAGLMLSAIDKKDTDGMLQAGGALDEVCEQCHRKYWYPNAPVPPGA